MNETNELEVLKRRVKELELDAEQPTTLGHKRVIQIIAGSKKYFCRTSEEEQIFSENNPGVETETFHIELLNSTAEKYLNDPENVKQFTRKIEELTEEPIEASSIASPTQTLSNEELLAEPVIIKETTWRQQAKELGIPMYQRTKEDVLADIVARTTISTS